MTNRRRHNALIDRHYYNFSKEWPLQWIQSGDHRTVTTERGKKNFIANALSRNPTLYVVFSVLILELMILILNLFVVVRYVLVSQSIRFIMQTYLNVHTEIKS